MPHSVSSTRTPLTVSASIVTANLLTLRDELERLLTAGVNSLHLDIEDGSFVPIMSLGTRLVEAAVEWGKLPVDVHLMVNEPEDVLRLLGSLPLRSVAIHAESTRYPRRVLRKVTEHGWKAGLALNPRTPVPELTALRPYLDYVLMLTTEPEDGDLTFLSSRLDAIHTLTTVTAPRGVSVMVDGGVNAENADLIAASGATKVVVGRALFAATDLASTVQRIKGGGTT